MTNTPTPAPAPMTAGKLKSLRETTEGNIRSRALRGLAPGSYATDIALLDHIDALTARVSRLLEAVEGAEKALTDIKEWKLPPSNCYWDKDRTDPMSYETAFGSNGARNHIRGVATSALATLRAAREGAR